MHSRLAPAAIGAVGGWGGAERQQSSREPQPGCHSSAHSWGREGTPWGGHGAGGPEPLQPRRSVPQSHSEPGQVGPRGSAAGPAPHGFPATALPH